MRTPEPAAAATIPAPGPPTEAGAPSVVDAVTEQIAFQIASGAYAPGDRIPSVRNLATAHGINPSTVQVVVARLKQAGFVEARPGVGLLVRDLELYGGIESWRYLFRFAQRLPERATKLFADILSTRRVLVVEVGRAVAADPGRYDPGPVRRAGEQLELLAASDPVDVTAVARAELQATRVMMRQADRSVVMALFNSIAEILFEVPAVRQAMYRDLSVNLLVWRELLGRWEAGTLTDAAVTAAETIFVEFDDATVEDFRRRVAGGV